MMMFKLIVLCALVAAPALGSAIYRETKGGRVQVEQQREQGALKGPAPKQEIVQQAEQREEVQQLASDELVQQKEEPAPKVEELAKGQRYEAKQQLSRDELAKGQTRAEEKFEQKFEQKLEQRQPAQKADWEGQQVELKEEQRQLEEQAPLEEQHLLVQQQEQFADAKGKPYGSAPAGQAEPYAFSYQVEGSSRSESSDANGVVRGQYTIQGAEGPSRVVDYVADQNGFRASVNTNEFGTESKSAANVALRTSQPNAEDITLRLEGKTREDLAAPAAPTKGGPAFAQRTESYAVKSAPQPALPLPLPLPIQQAPIPAAPKATKSIKREEIRAPAPAKGQRLVAQQQEELRDQQQEEELAPVEQLPAKGAQLKAPLKAPVAAPLPAQRELFKSATANGVYKAHRSPVATLVRGPIPVVHVHQPQVQVQGARYPPSPVQGYRRQQVAPRVASYAAVEDVQPSFD